MQYMSFNIMGGSYGLPVGAVERVLEAAAITEVPQSPPWLLGIVDIGGKLRPVLDLRYKFGLPAAELHPSQKFIVASTSDRTLVVVVDEVFGIVDQSEDVSPMRDLSEDFEIVSGVLKLSGTMILICDMERLLSEVEVVRLDEILEGAKNAENDIPSG